VPRSPTFRAIVNETLRPGAGEAARRRPAAVCFKVVARDLGDLKPRLSLDDVVELIEHVEGTLYR
jgi:hypothetical protein